MRVASLFVALACLCSCAARQQAQSYKSAEGPEFDKDRAACMQHAGFDAVTGGKITFGGGWRGNVFYAAGPYFDCMVARGYKDDAIGDPLGTPATERQMGGL